MKFRKLGVIAFVIVVMSTLAPTVIGGSGREEKAACVVTELMSCLPAILKGSQPPAYCCEMLKEQHSCLCGYIKTPAFGHYVIPKNAHKLLAACGIPYPKC
ncbi:hypothetical protein CARUB_v10018396mg [Capsella rubella]|uniref:Bifunctional inhibitor/plant lipid transfer protein/seed storage helical domain-containing protein n=1 Tax=Capsella rubella TaxID=81985 RepID=R0HMF1_9BRAS|nr:non-specific lipid-transfer protein 2 [Capsella rubella]EOA25088.1 hypothetical protein CARUB_v10018396mg [Capsella rubella]